MMLRAEFKDGKATVNLTKKQGNLLIAAKNLLAELSEVDALNEPETGKAAVKAVADMITRCVAPTKTPETAKK